jgi:hypothetical protein
MLLLCLLCLQARKALGLTRATAAQQELMAGIVDRLATTQLQYLIATIT